MNKLILKFILLFKSVFEKFGIDVKQLETILLVKLTMDDRRAYSYMGRGKQQKKESKNSSWMAMFMLFIMGCVMLIFLSLGKNSMLGHILYMSMFMVMIAMTLVSDFTSVLIDVRDNYIILPRPVKDSTITLARILHISIHVAKLMISLTLPGLVAMSFTDGIAGAIAFILEVFSATVFSIFVVNIIYLAVLKFSSPERFKGFISYFQIAFSVLIFASFQILPRMMNKLDTDSIDLLSYPVSYFLPPVWFASFYDIIVHPDNFSGIKAVLGTLGVLVPFVSVFVVSKYLAPGFNKKLSSISGSGDDPVGLANPTVNTSSAEKKPGLVYKLSNILTNHPVEQAGFRLTWWLTSRYRDFKVKVYPSFAYVPVYFAYFIFLRSEKTSMNEKMANFKEGNGYIFLTYLTGFVIMTVLQQITQSEKYKAAWVMFATPHNKPGKIVAGMYKAILCKYFMPFYLIISIFGLYVWGYRVINDLLFAFFNIIIYGMLYTIFIVKYLPFSQPTVVEGGKVFKSLFVMFLIGIFGLVHYLLSRWEWVITPLVLVSAIVCWFTFNYLQKRDWVALEADYG